MFEFLKKIINKASPEKKPAAKKEVVKKSCVNAIIGSPFLGDIRFSYTFIK